MNTIAVLAMMNTEVKRAAVKATVASCPGATFASNDLTVGAYAFEPGRGWHTYYFGAWPVSGSDYHPGGNPQRQIGAVLVACQRPLAISLAVVEHVVGRIGREVPSGDHIRKVIPVPIPNTEVKLSEPMIVPTSAKVGIAGF